MYRDIFYHTVLLDPIIYYKNKNSKVLQMLQI